MLLVSFPKATMKSLIQTVVGTEVPQNMAIAVSSMARPWLGKWWRSPGPARGREVGGAPPQQPKHPRQEAVSRLHSKEQIPNTKHKKRPILLGQSHEGPVAKGVGTSCRFLPRDSVWYSFSVTGRNGFTWILTSF